MPIKKQTEISQTRERSFLEAFTIKQEELEHFNKQEKNGKEGNSSVQSLSQVTDLPGSGVSFPLLTSCNSFQSPKEN